MKEQPVQPGIPLPLLFLRDLRAVTLVGLVCLALILPGSCGSRRQRPVHSETGTPSLHNVGLSDRRIAELAKTLADVRRDVPVAELRQRVQQLQGHCQEVIFPSVKGHEAQGVNVWFDDGSETARAWLHAQRERRFRQEWHEVLEELPFLAQVAFRPSLSVGRYTLNPTHALYVVTECRSAGDERFVTAFVRHETTHEHQLE